MISSRRQRLHRADSRDLKPVSTPPTRSPVARVRDVILIPSSGTASSDELLHQRPAGASAVRLSREMTLEQLPREECELIRTACTPRGHFFYALYLGGFYYAFVWELPQHQIDTSPNWDPAGELYAALAFSRLIVDNAHTTEYAARVTDYQDGEKQVRPALAREAAVAFRSDPQKRDWLVATEAAKLSELLSRTLAGSDANVPLPQRVMRANWLQEYATRVQYADLVLPLLVTALEALVHTGRDASTKQFTARVAKVAAEVGVQVSEDWCSDVYGVRSGGVHGQFVNAFSFEGSATGLEYVAKAQMIVRRVILRAVDDSSFRAIFETDETVRQYCPVHFKGKSV
jgi:hypothetical protein